MQPAALLEEIWTGRIRPACASGVADLETLLEAMLPVRLISLTRAGGADRPLLMPDSTEMMPDLPLGDVLAEELDLIVAPGTLVLIADTRAAASMSEVSARAGAAMGDLLHRLVARADLPLSQETEALVRLVRACQARAARLGTRVAGFDAAAFGDGLAVALGLFWAGDAAAPIRGADFLDRDEVLSYLRALDPAFSGKASPSVPDLLAGPSGLSRRFEDWASPVLSALRAHLGPAQTVA